MVRLEACAQQDHCVTFFFVHFFTYFDFSYMKDATLIFLLREYLLNMNSRALFYVTCLLYNEDFCTSIVSDLTLVLCIKFVPIYMRVFKQFGNLIHVHKCLPIVFAKYMVIDRIIFTITTGNTLIIPKHR